MKKLLYILLICLTLGSCTSPSKDDFTIVPCAPIPVGLASATAFAFDGKGYVFGGRDQEGLLHNELWMYNPIEDTWTCLGETPLQPRVRACACATEREVFIGLGSIGKVYNESCYLKDWWAFSPATNMWEQKASLNTNNTIGGIAYLQEDTIYVAYSSGFGFSRDVELYSLADDAWTLRPDNWHRALSGLGVTGCSVAGKAFLGTGFNTNNLNQWYEINLPTDEWMRCPDVPNGKRSLAVCSANSRYIYLFGGRFFGGELTRGKIYSDIECFDLAANKWTKSGIMPYGEAENMIAFTIGETIYFGLGEDANGTIHQQLYRIEP